MNHLLPYINNPYDPVKNLNLGLEYEALGQTAAAVSFYLRAAERTLNKTLQYISLIRMALCFERQGRRDLTVKTLLYRAIETCPNRPEAYFFLSRFHERQKQYHECYLYSSIGLELPLSDLRPIDNVPEYPGRYGLLLEKGIAAWWVGRTEESRSIIYDLHTKYSTVEPYTSCIVNNIKNIGLPMREFKYSQSYQNDLKYSFENLSKVPHNYSEVHQDLFVLTMLNGKTNGIYLEIGCGHAFKNNNTALLETIFNWKGISIDLDQELVNDFNLSRKNPAIAVDAVSVNYSKLLDSIAKEGIVDYLQVDISPKITLQVLQTVIETGYKFRVITFEHDYYQDKDTRQASRDLLNSHGYTLLINDISNERGWPFEDWWVLADQVRSDVFLDINHSEPIHSIKDIFYKTT